MEKIILLISLIYVSILLIILLIGFYKQTDILIKLQFFNAFNSLLIIFLCIYFYYSNTPEYIDIALLYAIVSYVSTLGVSKYFKAIIKTKGK